jgi:ATP-binding cassette subfamily F protein 3
MIRLLNITLHRGPKLLLQNADATVHAGWKVGITGANGTGKSSLLALLLNQLHADQGECELPGSWEIAHVAQETPTGEQSALDYVLAGDAELARIQTQLNTPQGMENAALHAKFEALDGYTAHSRAGQLLHGLGFAAAEENKPVNSFSGGWRMRLNLAQALMCRSDLLLLDEPTNHLDLDAVIWFEDWLRRYPGTLLLISHDRDFLNSVCDHILHLEQQTLALHNGNYDAFEHRRAEQLAQQQAAYQKQQREIEHIRQFVTRFRAKATKAKQAQSRIKALERMELIQAAHVDSGLSFEFPAPDKVPNPLLSGAEVSVGYQDTPILRQLNFALTPASRIGLLGPNGAGKSTFIKLLSGSLAPQSGELRAAEDLRIGYFAQHQMDQLDPNASPLLHVQRLSPQASEQRIRDFLGGFGFIGDMASNPTAPFSGGEKARLALALLVWQKPNLLLLDEPTNHLDLHMRDALTMALQDFQGALIVVSHDRHLLRTVSDDLWLVAQGEVKPFDGDLDDYRRWLDQHRAKTPAKIDAAQCQQSKQETQARRAERRQLENRLKKLDKDMDKASAEKSRLEALLGDPAVYDNRAKAAELAQQLQQAGKDLEAIELEWMAVSEALERG